MNNFDSQIHSLCLVIVMSMNKWVAKEEGVYPVPVSEN